MPRLAIAAFVLGTVLFVAGIAQSTNALVLAGAVCAAVMLVALFLADRAETQAITATGAGRSSRPVSGTESQPMSHVSTTTAPEASSGSAKTATAVLEDVSVEELLASIQGLGPRKVEALSATFRTSAALRAADKHDLTAVQGIGPAIADRILSELR